MINQVEFIEQTDGYYLLSGKLVFDTVGDLAQHILRGNDRIIIDCSNVSHMDSAGIALLVEWKRQAYRLGQDLLLKDLPQQAKAIIKATRLDTLLGLKDE
jgi:phospholipid transport system transporter-binding protein